MEQCVGCNRGSRTLTVQTGKPARGATVKFGKPYTRAMNIRSASVPKKQNFAALICPFKNVMLDHVQLQQLYRTGNQESNVQFRVGCLSQRPRSSIRTAHSSHQIVSGSLERVGNPSNEASNRIRSIRMSTKDGSDTGPDISIQQLIRLIADIPFDLPRMRVFRPDSESGHLRPERASNSRCVVTVPVWQQRNGTAGCTIFTPLPCGGSCEVAFMRSPNGQLSITILQLERVAWRENAIRRKLETALHIAGFRSVSIRFIVSKAPHE
jgi:hypothetical protein